MYKPMRWSESQICNNEHLAGFVENLEPKVKTDFTLERHGLEYKHPDVKEKPDAFKVVANAYRDAVFS